MTGDSPGTADTERVTWKDPGRWAWRGLAILCAVLFLPQPVVEVIRGHPLTVPLALGLAFFAGIAMALWWAGRSEVTIVGQVVVVRNVTRTYRVQASDVRDVEVASAAGGLRWCLNLRLEDGSLVPMTALPSPFNAFNGRPTVNRHRGQLLSAIRVASS